MILNPYARLAPDLARREAFVAALGRSHRVRLVIPTSADDATRCAADAAASGADVVVAAGGDGTMNRVARALAGTATPLALFPIGSANDLARELGVPDEPAAAARRAADGSARPLDVVRVGGNPTAAPDALFVGVGGLALTARTALSVTRAKTGAPLLRAAVTALGGSVYRFAATGHLLFSRVLEDPMRFVIDGGAPFTQLCVAVFITNHRLAGGGLSIPGAGLPDDGVMELCLVPARARPTLLTSFARLSAGAPLAPGIIVPHRARAAEIETSREDALVADGDCLATGTHFSLRVDPRALTIRA